MKYIKDIIEVDPTKTYILTTDIANHEVLKDLMREFQIATGARAAIASHVKVLEASAEQEAIQRVREIHIPDSMQPHVCDVCLDYYPCKTIRALDGEQDATQ